MRAIIGTTRSGKPILISTSPPEALLTPNMTLADVFDVFCTVTYLRVCERNGWCLVTDRDKVFHDILDDLDIDPLFLDAITDSRRREPDRTFVDDMNTGRDLVLAPFRA